MYRNRTKKLIEMRAYEAICLQSGIAGIMKHMVLWQCQDADAEKMDLMVETLKGFADMERKKQIPKKKWWDAIDIRDNIPKWVFMSNILAVATIFFCLPFEEITAIIILICLGIIHAIATSMMVIYEKQPVARRKECED